MTKFVRDEHDNDLFISYRVTECVDQDRAVYTYYFDTLGEANAYAEKIWFNHLTEGERKHRHVYVLMVKACASLEKANKMHILQCDDDDLLAYGEEYYDEETKTLSLDNDGVWDLFGCYHADGAFDSENLPEEEEEDEEDD